MKTHKAVTAKWLEMLRCRLFTAACGSQGTLAFRWADVDCKSCLRRKHKRGRR